MSYEDETKFIIGMHDAFFNALYQIALKDKNVVIITADNGAPTLDQFYENIPDQYFTVGIAEQQMIGMAAGMAFEGRKVYTYAIAPFVTTRVHEQVKLDMCAMNLPIVNLGVGAGYAYDIMGPSHHTVEDIAIMRSLPNMKIHSPVDSICAEALADISYKDPAPQYIRFDRAGIPNLYEGKNINFEEGIVVAREGTDLYFVATGVSVHQALEVSDELAKNDISAGVLDIHRIKPINKELLLKHVSEVSRIVTFEEHLLCGGLGSIVAEIFIDNEISTPCLRIGQKDTFVFEYGGREEIWKQFDHDLEGATKKILNWLDIVKVD